MADMKPDERRERIASVVRDASRASVDELAAMLDISHETIRRDLAVLSERGVLRKVHGGAVDFRTALESPLHDRRATARAEKLAIARRGAQLFQPGDSIFIDSGTTTGYFAQELGKAGRFTVITNSALIASELSNTPAPSDVYLLGGKYSAEGQHVLGSLVVDQIAAMHADHVVLTIGAMSQAGAAMDFNADEAYVARAMIGSAREVTILADSSKLERHALFQVCQAVEVDRLVTDKAPSPGLAEILAGAGVDVVIA
ncbi:MAG: DeoR/GlpR family DNA-binding transcription regulator [Devosia sp.]